MMKFDRLNYCLLFYTRKQLSAFIFNIPKSTLSDKTVFLLTLAAL